jgi:hypothetical protein
MIYQYENGEFHDSPNVYGDEGPACWPVEDHGQADV